MRNGKCPKCGSGKIGHLAELNDEIGGYEPVFETLGVRIEPPNKYKWWMGPEYRGEVHREGALEAYVCTSCGFLETYVRDPRSVPFESLIGFTWVGAGEGGPYR